MSGDTSCCTMTINCTLLCCAMLYCTCFVCLMTFCYFSNILIKKFMFQVQVHGILENPFFYRGIEIGIENRVILLALAPTTEFLVS